MSGPWNYKSNTTFLITLIFVQCSFVSGKGIAIPQTYRDLVLADSVRKRDQYLRDNFNILTDSTKHYTYGSCPKDALSSVGQQAMAKLLKANRIDLIWKVLDGNNNVGKILAIETLIEYYEFKETVFSDEQKQKLKTLIESDFAFRACIGGCTGLNYISSSMERVRSDKKYRKVLKRTGIIIDPGIYK